MPVGCAGLDKCSSEPGACRIISSIEMQTAGSLCPDPYEKTTRSPKNPAQQNEATMLNVRDSNVGTLIIRAGSRGMLYYNYNKESPPKKYC